MQNLLKEGAATVAGAEGKEPDSHKQERRPFISRPNEESEINQLRIMLRFNVSYGPLGTLRKGDDEVRVDRTVIVIGAFLFILGLAVAWNGYGYVQIERGWTLVISGTVAFSTGLLLVAIGLVLSELRAIAASAGRATLLLAKARSPQSSEFEEPSYAALEERIQARLQETRQEARHEARQEPPQEPPPQFQPEPIEAPQREERFDAPVSREGGREPEQSAERALQRRLPRVSEALAGAASAANPLAWMKRPERPPSRPPVESTSVYSSVSLPASRPATPEESPREEAALSRAEPESAAREPEDLSAEDLSGSLDAPVPELARGPDRDPLPEPTPEPEPEPEPGAAGESDDRQVIGHYDAQGAHYTMYADGSIDAETVHGVYRFASMEELKQFIERQDSDKI